MTRPIKGVWIFESQLYICGTAIKLTVGEFKVFSTLYSQPDRIFTREEIRAKRILDAYYHDGSDRAIDSFVRRIRKKIIESVGISTIVISHRGIGYQLNRDWYKA